MRNRRNNTLLKVQKKTYEKVPRRREEQSAQEDKPSVELTVSREQNAQEEKPSMELPVRRLLCRTPAGVEILLSS
ncbi:hypothetical protein NDU88_002107 [Pleurodeles waltl]|uniref:Uncharacterized protein n=1 Tax=Pleurodeles waltl TaxID=8319 RepID=A0AAV7T1U1_PLEWA|nr:hypothetical protein NDU88_002107 [Pleurodeles waltl]